MDINNSYYKQVQLLLQALPFIAEQTCFALKGGTAINLFVRDFPRLSVDIDLVYLPHEDRPEALAHITDALDEIGERLTSTFPNIKITKSYEDKIDALRLVIFREDTSVKVELSPVLRGTVFEPTLRQTTGEVERKFGFAEVQVVALEDLYAGKLCAAFDRQHPRDFFDVMLLLENEGITDGIRQAFLVYLISHRRPMHELLTPRWKPIDRLFRSEFRGMSFKESSPEHLEHAAKDALQRLLSDFTDQEKQFLCSMYTSTQDWEALPFNHIQDLPAIKWKLLNIKSMDKMKREIALKDLRLALGIIDLNPNS